MTGVVSPLVKLPLGYIGYRGRYAKNACYVHLGVRATKACSGVANSLHVSLLSQQFKTPQPVVRRFLWDYSHLMSDLGGHRTGLHVVE